MSYGAQVKLGIARQASAGTAVTDPGSYHALPFTNEDVGLEKDELISQNLIGRFEQGAAYDGTANISGAIEFEATPRNLLAMIGATLTHLPAIVTSGSVLTRTFLPNTQDFSATLVKAPWSIYKQFSDSNSAEQFYDCQFGQLDLIFSAGQFTKGRATLVGGTRTLNGIGSMAVMPDAADVGRLMPWNVASISIGGTGVGNFSDVTVSLNESIEPLYTINGTLAPFKYTRSGFREVTVNGTFYMTDRTTLNDFVAGTLRRLLIYSVSSPAAIQSGYFNTLLIDVPQMKVTAFKPGASGPGEVSVSFTGRGVIDPSSAYALQITLQNTFAAAL